MKPLPVATYTDEDSDIWLGWVRRYNPFGSALSFHSLDGDRRDAEQLLQLQRLKMFYPAGHNIMRMQLRRAHAVCDWFGTDYV